MKTFYIGAIILSFTLIIQGLGINYGQSQKIDEHEIFNLTLPNVSILHFSLKITTLILQF